MSHRKPTAGKVGPIRTPMAGYLVNKPELDPPTGANTTIPGTAPKAAPIQSPMGGSQIKPGRGEK
jgi:hypothetical protein